MKWNVKRSNIRRALVFILITGSLVFLAGCPDPNESGIPDGKDFKESELNVDPDEARIKREHVHHDRVHHQ